MDHGTMKVSAGRLLEAINFSLLLGAGLSRALQKVRDGLVLLTRAELQRWKKSAASPGSPFLSYTALPVPFFLLSNLSLPNHSLWPLAHPLPLRKTGLHHFCNCPSSTRGMLLDHLLAAALAEQSVLALPSSPGRLCALCSWPPTWVIGAPQFFNIPLELWEAKLNI